jgi:hypothetical protein
MDEIRNIERRLDDSILRRKQNDIKICFNNLDSIFHIIDELNNNNNDLFNQHKEKLKVVCEEEKKANIEYIINLSYATFIDNINEEKDFKPLLEDIQKSSFYSEYKNDDLIKKMENLTKIFDLNNEIEKNKNYRFGLDEFKELEKKNFDEEIKTIIEDNIERCKRGILSDKIMDIEKQMDQNNVEKVINVFETILNDLDGDYNFSDDITKIYQLIIKGIETKIIKGNSYNNEFKKLEDIIKKNKYNLDDYDEYIELLENLKSL